MKASSAKAIFKAFNQGKIRYLVAGGIAVNAYGYLRFTKDIDFLIELVSENIVNAFRALESLGYRPNVPITAEQFANPDNRRRWINEKGMKVLQFWSDEHRETPVDVFIDMPFDFASELSSAKWKGLHEIGQVPVVSLRTLVRLKKAANRDQDVIDLKNLRLYYPEDVSL